MVGRFASSARAASGHAAAAPPSATNNSRRLMVTVIRPSRARCVNGTIPRHERAVFTLACWNSRAAIADAPILLLLRASPPARLSLTPSQISARNGATRLAPPHAKYQPDRKRAWLGSKIMTGFRRWHRAKVATRAACGGWESPAALRHKQPGRWMAIPGGFAACTAGDPDGTRTDDPRPPTLIGQPPVPAQSKSKVISRPAL